MNVYIDFDRTLFNCDQFLEDFYALTNQYQIPKDIFKECQIQCKIRGFNPHIILKEVFLKHSFDEMIYQDIDMLLKHSKDYLYSDTVVFLEYLKNKGYKIIILTKGNSEYQKEKITNSQIDDYYQDLIVTMEHKGNLDIDYSNSIFIDDNPKEILNILKQKPKMIIRIQRDNSKYSKTPLKEDIKTVKSLQEIIDKKIID